MLLHLLVLEKEAFALLFNFGVFGITLYLGPIIFIIVEAGVLIITRKIKMNSNGWLTIFILLMVLSFSSVIGYVLFNITNSTMVVALCAMLIKRLEEQE